MAKMPRPGRINPSCGLVIHPDRGPELVVAGGVFDGISDEILDTVDIYTVNTDSWREGML